MGRDLRNRPEIANEVKEAFGERNRIKVFDRTFWGLAILQCKDRLAAVHRPEPQALFMMLRRHGDKATTGAIENKLCRSRKLLRSSVKVKPADHMFLVLGTFGSRDENFALDAHTGKVEVRDHAKLIGAVRCVGIVSCDRAEKL